MKICRLNTSFQHLNKMCGWMVSSYYMSKIQAKRGNDVHIIAGKPRKGKDFEKLNGFKVHRVFSFAPRTFHLQTLVYGLSSLKKFKELNKKYDFDIVHGHDKDPFIFSIYNKISKLKPFVLHSHGLTKTWFDLGIIKLKTRGKNMLYHNLTDFYFRVLYEKIAHKNADLIFAVSKAYKNEISKVLNINKEKIFVCYNGVDIDLFKEIKSAKKKLNLSKDKVCFLMVGSDLRKGIKVFLDAIKIFRKKYKNKFTVLLIGTNKEAIKRLNENYLFPELKTINFLPYLDMPLYYNACDVFVLPTFYDTFGKAVAEAMACKKPVISTNVGGVPEVVGKQGILVPPGNPEKLAEKMELLFLDSKLRKEIGRKARTRVKNLFTWEKTVKRINEGYKMVIK